MELSQRASLGPKAWVLEAALALIEAKRPVSQGEPARLGLAGELSTCHLLQMPPAAGEQRGGWGLGQLSDREEQGVDPCCFPPFFRINPPELVSPTCSSTSLPSLHCFLFA